MDAPPLHALSLAIAQKCNLGCTYCYAQQGEFGDKAKSMEERQAIKAVDLLLSQAAPGAKVNLAFMGGEPLSNRAVLRSVTDYASRQAALREIDCRFSITTNGTLLRPDDALAAVPHVANAGSRPPQPKPMARLDPALPVRLHGAAAIVELPCVVDDRVCLHTALDHPHLERPLAFLDNEALFPHLAKLAQPLPLARLLDMLTTSMSGRKAQRIAAWLWQHGLLESVG